MSLKWVITGVLAVVSLIFTFLLSVYPNEIHQIISSTIPISDVAFVYSTLLVTFLLLLVTSVFYIGFLIYKKLKFDVIIQDDSLRFNKYPYLVGHYGRLKWDTNMSYAEVTVQNCRKTELKKCSLEIILRKEGKDIYCEKVLSADSTNEPNPIMVSIDGTRKVGFHPVCLRLASFQAFLPDHSSGTAGYCSGKLIKYDEYEIFGKVIYDGKLGKLTYLGKINIPADFLTKAKIPNDIQVIIDQGGFAVYAELVKGKVRAKFFGHNNDDDIRDALQHLKRKYLRTDDLIEDNGKLRKRPSLR